MGRHDTNALLVLLTVACCACSTTRSVRPVGTGNLATAISVGGPLFVNLGPPLPVPVPVLYGRYGLTAKTDVDVGVLLPLAATLSVDAGVSQELCRERGLVPTVMGGARLAVVTALRDVGPPLLLVEGHGTASWTVAHRLLGYVGLDVMANIAGKRVHPTALLGLSYAVPLGGLTFAAEARWLGFDASSRNLSIRYASFDGRGALGVVLSAAYTFDLKGRHRGH